MRRSLRMRECFLYLLNRIYRLDWSVYRPIEYLSNQLVIDRLNACAVTFRQRASKHKTLVRYASKTQIGEIDGRCRVTH